MERDTINWAEMNIPVLFRKIFFPTLLGMLLSASVAIVDGICVGHGIGSDGLAAVNIVVPFFMVTTGIGLMFGSGASVVAAVHLSQGREKAANINITQAFIVSTLIMLVLAAAIMFFPDATARLMGSSERLMPSVIDYMSWVVPSLPCAVIMSMGLFVIRLDGSPVYSMLCNAIPGIVNVVLDIVFVFPLQMGIEGAALATCLSELLGCMMVLAYMFGFSRTLHFHRIKMSLKSLLLTARNIGYQCKVGVSALIGELAISVMIFVGNYAFMSYFGEDGVAAFSVACLCFPLSFMIGNAVAQSAQPIISYNHGAGLYVRVTQAFRLSLIVGTICGILSSVGGYFEAGFIIRLFLPDVSAATDIANAGFPYFAFAFLFFTLNLVFIGYYQSLEQFKQATFFMLLRGMIFVVPAFLLLPKAIGEQGLWLAVPLSEAMTFAVILLYNGRKRLQGNR